MSELAVVVTQNDKAKTKVSIPLVADGDSTNFHRFKLGENSLKAIGNIYLPLGNGKASKK